MYKISLTLRHLPSNRLPYFSVTFEEWVWRECTTIGCCPDTVLGLRPDLADIVAYNLRDVNGMPMYAVDNGAYFLGLTKWEPYDSIGLMQHFGLSLEEADALHASIKTESDLKFWVDQQRLKWKVEADRLIEKYDLDREKNRVTIIRIVAKSP